MLRPGRLDAWRRKQSNVGNHPVTRITRRRTLTEDELRWEITFPQLEEAGGWEEIFGRSGDLYLEVGLGKDPHILDQARNSPENLFVGIEYSRKKLEKVLFKISAAGGQDNLRILHADAFRSVDPAFEDQSLAGAFILFPDPWPKARHARRRLLQDNFLSLLTRKLRPTARLEIRTDDVDYAREASEVLDSIEGLSRITGKDPFLEQPIEPAHHLATLFEKKFTLLGKKIHYFYLEKTVAKDVGST